MPELSWVWKVEGLSLWTNSDPILVALVVGVLLSAAGWCRPPIAYGPDTNLADARQRARACLHPHRGYARIAGRPDRGLGDHGGCRCVDRIWSAVPSRLRRWHC